MLRVFRKTLAHQLCTAGDHVMGGAPIPSESSFNNLWGEMHVVGNAAISVLKASMYGVDGYLVPVEDPDSNTSYNSIWDNLVPKDNDVITGLFSSNPEDADADPAFEPGEPNLDALMGHQAMGADPQFYKRRKLLSFANTPSGFEAGSPDTYIPRDIFKIRSSRKMFADAHALAMVAISVPNMTDTSTSIWTTDSEPQWMQRKYLEMVLEQAWIDLVGLSETGAESPWTDASLLLEEFLEPDILEETADAFTVSAFNVWCYCTWDISVPGRLQVKSLSLG